MDHSGVAIVMPLLENVNPIALRRKHGHCIRMTTTYWKPQLRLLRTLRKERNDYQNAKDLGLISKNRWEEGMDHHPMSTRIMKFLAEHDYQDYHDYFCWKGGGDDYLEFSLCMECGTVQGTFPVSDNTIIEALG